MLTTIASNETLKDVEMIVVATAGYEGTDIDRFVRTLRAIGITQLADVRAVALSRKKGFSKTALRDRLEKEGIRYTHFRDLGDPKPGREAARAGNFDLFRAIYGRHLATEAAQNALDELGLFVQGGATCLLCFERDPETCHRLIVTDALEGKLGTQTLHLYPEDPDRYVRNRSKLPRFRTGESTAAA